MRVLNLCFAVGVGAVTVTEPMEQDEDETNSGSALGMAIGILACFALMSIVLLWMRLRKGADPGMSFRRMSTTTTPQQASDADTGLGIELLDMGEGSSQLRLYEPNTMLLPPTVNTYSVSQL